VVAERWEAHPFLNLSPGLLVVIIAEGVLLSSSLVLPALPSSVPMGTLPSPRGDACHLGRRRAANNRKVRGSSPRGTTLSCLRAEQRMRQRRETSELGAQR